MLESLPCAKLDINPSVYTMYVALKRALDICLALLAFAIALPFGIVIAFVLFMAQRQVIFRQPRPGLNGKPFLLYKFCSMNNARDANGNLLPDQQRLTRVGSLIRKLSLDELPQLWNVLKGDMSMVGPRPLLMAYLDRYTPEQARRHDVKPGITGWAQINGRNSLDWDQKFGLDLWYVDNKSLTLDLSILLRTVIHVMRRQDISNRGHATMPEFLGSQQSHHPTGEMAEPQHRSELFR